jgi:hypothetical protein
MSSPGLFQDATQFARYKTQGLLLRWNRYVRKVLVLRFSEPTAGLGDQMWHTHLPRVAKQSGAYDRVLYSLDSVYRHEGMFEVLWKANPHIDEFVPRMPGFSFVNVRELQPGCNKLDQIMMSALIDDGCRNHEPEIYSRFAPIAELQGKTLYDPNFVTEAGEVSNDLIAAFLKQRSVTIDFQFAPRWNSHPLAGVPVLPPCSLDWFCRAIVSCSSLYCFTTGTASLAPALGKGAHVFFGAGVSRACHHSAMNTYIELSPSAFSGSTLGAAAYR